MRKEKIFCLFLGAAAFLMAGSLWALAKETGSAEELQEGQRMARIRVVSIVGNELTYYEIEEDEEETEKQTEETADLSESKRISESKTEGAAEDTFEGGTEGSGREFHGGDFPAGELPDDFSLENSGSFSRGRMEQQESAQTVTVYLPVAVRVHTDREEDRTFSILEAGDELEVLFQEDEAGEETIIEIWMREAEGETE